MEQQRSANLSVGGSPTSRLRQGDADLSASPSAALRTRPIDQSNAAGDALGVGGGASSLRRESTTLFEGGLSRAVTATFDPVDVPADEAVMLNPIEKLLRYGVFPSKLILHSTILIVLLVYTFAYFKDVEGYNQNARFGLARSLFDPEDNTDPSLEQRFASIDDAVAAIHDIAAKYYTIPETSPGVFMHYVVGSDLGSGLSPVPPLLRMVVIADPNEVRSQPLPDGIPTELYWFNLTRTADGRDVNLGPLTDPSLVGITHTRQCRVEPTPQGEVIPCRQRRLAELFDRMVDAQITMAVRSVRFYKFGNVASVARWRITFTIAFEAHGSEVVITAKFSQDLTDQPATIAVVLTCMLVPLVLLHLLLRLRAFQRYHVHMRQLLPQWAQLETTASRVRRERHAGTSWKVFAIVVDLFCLTFAVLSFSDMYVQLANEDVQIWKKLMLAFSCFGYSVLYVSYLQTSPQFYVLVKTISMAIPAMTRYSAGVFPLFAGFALAGTVVFGPWAQDTFGNVHRSFCTLFCVLGGDSLLQLSTEINQSDFWLLRQTSRLFMMSFLAYFYNNASNIMLAIVQDSFTQVREMFEMCEWDLDRCNEELDLHHLTAAERHRKKAENRRRRKMRTSKRFSQYETGSTTDDESQDTSTSSSDFSALGRGEVTAKGLRRLADRIAVLQPLGGAGEDVDCRSACHSASSRTRNRGRSPPSQQ